MAVNGSRQEIQARQPPWAGHGQDAGRLEHVQRELMQIAGLAPAQAHEHRGIAQVALRTL
jgi:hypothetical protein